MPSILNPAGAPQWLTSVLRDIERSYAPLFPKTPLRLASYLSTSLPNASDYPQGLIWISNLNTVAISNGTQWIKLTMGSAV